DRMPAARCDDEGHAAVDQRFRSASRYPGTMVPSSGPLARVVRSSPVRSPFHEGVLGRVHRLAALEAKLRPFDLCRLDRSGLIAAAVWTRTTRRQALLCIAALVPCLLLAMGDHFFH